MTEWNLGVGMSKEAKIAPSRGSGRGGNSAGWIARSAHLLSLSQPAGI